MNRIDRISAILIQLQSKRVVKGQDIADRFSISLRTAYRDIRTLEEAGVPIVSEAGIGYSLMDGYRLPPVMFTQEEATAFLTAEKLVEKLTDSETHQIYQSALFKIKAVLRNDEKDHLETMYDHIEVKENPYLPKDKKTSNSIQTILRSLSRKNVLSMDYLANISQEKTIRKVEPIGIFLEGSKWYMIAFCLLRNDYRTFRIDRIAKISITQLEFQKEHPSVKTYLNEITKTKKDLQKVVILIEKKVLKYIGEQKYYSGFISEREVDDQMEMTFLTSSLEGFARWYLMYGDHARIVSPTALKTRVKEIISQFQKNLR